MVDQQPKTYGINDGNSRGIVTAWSPFLQRIAVRKKNSVIETKLRDGETWIEFTVLNVYRLLSLIEKPSRKISFIMERWIRKM